jgi:polysaccharide deacetylase 2 family uncharacterized protein YibQ
MKILYVQHDMLVWASARQWSYTTHMAYVEGLRAAGHEVLLEAPMEPNDYPQNDPGPFTLLASAAPAETI